MHFRSKEFFCSPLCCKLINFSENGLILCKIKIKHLKNLQKMITISTDLVLTGDVFETSKRIQRQHAELKEKEGTRLHYTTREKKE